MRRLWIPMKCGRTNWDLVATFDSTTDGWLLIQSAPAGSGGIAGSLDVSGQFLVGAGYQGCAGCRNDSFVRCGTCGNISCSRYGDTYFRCSWCGLGGSITEGVYDVRAADGSA